MTPKERLIRILQVEAPIYKSRLLASFRNRDEYSAALSELLTAGFVHQTGLGTRGMPFKIVLSGTWPYNVCPLCGHVSFPRDQHSEQPLRPTEPVRRSDGITVDKVIALLERHGGSTTVRVAQRVLNANRHKEAWAEIQSSPLFAFTGTGKAGDPKIIHLAGGKA